MYLLYLSKTKIEVFKNEVKISEISWTKDNLSQTLTRLKETFSSRFRILLSDEFINITSLLVSKKESKKRKLIQAKAQSIISQNLDQTTWDYKIIANQEKLKLIQVIFLNKDFFEQFRLAVYNSKIKIKLVESFSTSICRFLSKNKLVFLLFQNLIVISYNKTPIFTKILDKKLTQNDLEEVFTYTKNRFKILPQQIIFSPTGDTAFAPYDFSGLVPEYLDINPITGLIHSPNIAGSDEDTSRLEIKQPSPIILKQSSIVKKITIILTIYLVIILALIISNKNIFIKNTNQLSSNSQTTLTDIPTPTPTINFGSFKIQVLNGSGVVGEAVKVSALLSKNKFNVNETGNASDYEFIKTEIQTKESISKSVIDLIINSLEEEYTSTVSANKLDNSNEYDIIITTGKTN